jgi:hypothetical protein
VIFHKLFFCMLCCFCDLTLRITVEMCKFPRPKLDLISKFCELELELSLELEEV